MRRARLNCKTLPGEIAARDQARALHAQGKSLLVISVLTGLPRRSLAVLLGLPAPPTDDGCTIVGQDGRVGERSTTPALWGTDAVFDGPIKPRTYRVLHDADLTTSGHAVGSEWLTTHDFGEAINNCHGKNSVVVDDHGLVLAKGVRKDRYDN
jgi:hypothetical protein